MGPCCRRIASTTCPADGSGWIKRSDDWIVGPSLHAYQSMTEIASRLHANPEGRGKDGGLLLSRSPVRLVVVPFSSTSITRVRGVPSSFSPSSLRREGET